MTTQGPSAARNGSRRTRRSPRMIGWREWVTLHDLGGAAVKAKVDTGARTSALHAFKLRVVANGRGPLAHFEVHPEQRTTTGAVSVVSPVVGWRTIRSSNGDTEDRPVIRTRVRIGPVSFPIDVTLTNRDEMGFRMLLGRAAVRRRFVVDPGRSYLISTDEPAESPVN